MVVTMVNVSSLQLAGGFHPDFGCLALADSIRRNGFDLKQPLRVLQKGNTYLVIDGNHRAYVLDKLRVNESAMFARMIPGGKVPVLVVRKLRGR